MKQKVAAALIAFLVSAVGTPLEAQTEAETLLANASALRCSFTVSVRTTWKNGVPEPALRRTGNLVVTIRNINAASGSALLIRTPINKDLTLMVDEKARYFIDAGGGRVTMTMVFGEFSSGMKFRAAHTIHDFEAIVVGSFRSEPEILQHWGECEIAAPEP